MLPPTDDVTPTTDAAGPREETPMPVMTEAAWTTAEPGWRWVALPVEFFGDGRMDERVLEEVVDELGRREVRAIRVVGDFNSRGTCFDGEWERARATAAHEELNATWGGVAIDSAALAALQEIEAWVAAQFAAEGFDVRVGARVVELIESASVPEDSAFRPRARIDVLLRALPETSDSD